MTQSSTAAAPPGASRGSLRPGRYRLAGFVALGALAGVAAKAGDESGWQWTGDLGTYPAAWVLAVALIGRFAPGAGAAALGGAVFFASMTAAYYGWAVFVLGSATAPS